MLTGIQIGGTARLPFCDTNTLRCFCHKKAPRLPRCLVAAERRVARVRAGTLSCASKGYRDGRRPTRAGESPHPLQTCVAAPIGSTGEARRETEKALRAVRGAGWRWPRETKGLLSQSSGCPRGKSRSGCGVRKAGMFGERVREVRPGRLHACLHRCR